MVGGGETAWSENLSLCHFQGSEWNVQEIVAKVAVPGLKLGRQVNHGALGLVLFWFCFASDWNKGGACVGSSNLLNPHTVQILLRAFVGTSGQNKQKRMKAAGPVMPLTMVPVAVSPFVTPAGHASVSGSAG